MGKRWIASWSAAPMNVWGPDAPLSGFYGQTVREVARLSVGGTGVVVRLTNEYGSNAISLDAVSIAFASEHGGIEPLTSRPLTFNGSRAMVIPPGSSVISDPLDMELRPFARLSVSYYGEGFVPIETHHLEAQQTAYISVPGDFSSAGEMIIQQTTTSHYLLSDIYVEAAANTRAVICFGDSITDGYGSTIDADRRWPDVFAERFSGVDGLGEVAVINQGIGGNRMLHSCRGSRAIQRFDRDVLRYNCASHLVILIGINDIVWPNTVLAGPQEVVSSGEMIAAYQQLVARARLSGLKTMLCTLLPFEGTNPEFPKGGYYTTAKERIRQSVNYYIRNDSDADTIMDFDALMRDPHVPRGCVLNTTVATTFIRTIVATVSWQKRLIFHLWIRQEALSWLVELALHGIVSGPVRGGSVRLNSFERLAKWISASIMLRPSSVSARRSKPTPGLPRSRGCLYRVAMARELWHIDCNSNLWRHFFLN
ncbi:GDSL-type esterase/lipase family protein (plasmid) [Rhizobium sp. 32-5/1]|uniref:GDSL-type esterase/lipase family protein n=1 Tax=Rhizobium sp. 32-5/1 TaxID=3019602 RepID=UPI00240CF11B|nr:GDSL-type esterase/lipase family protein [Rhizobium sp. 32-5/1]WEZ85438.1 GDSL-type esterase/lipase family protein [Rhizobium sp. 32-5/1]